METYVFDGTFDGLLTAVFEFYERKPADVALVAVQVFQPGLLDEHLEVVADPAKSKRVWDGLRKKLTPDWQKRFYTAFLAETPEIYQHLFDFTRYIFDNPAGAQNNFGHPAVIAISKAERSVSRESHRMKAFIRFQETADGIFYAPIEPDFNVLPLIAGFFKNRYADQKWIIYDLKRKYGLYFDLEKVEEVTFDFIPEVKSAVNLPEDSLHEKEGLYSLLWHDYFRSTNIPARKNMKLHIQHVPKRYWKYLGEKQDPEVLHFIAIIPPKEIAAEITSIKQDFSNCYDSHRALKVMPHITLKSPFKFREADKDMVVKWFDNLRLTSAPFIILLNNFGSFANKKAPVIYIKPEVSEPLKLLQRDLITGFSEAFPNLKSENTDDAFTPHMTVAYRDLTPENFNIAWKKYQHESYQREFMVHEIHLLRHDGTKWNIIRSRQLG
ncbi:MAG TPA: TIGR03915 family putative DNA repair protein [Flavobacterium sp.]|jgi:probable DNA metabolism protein